MLLSISLRAFYFRRFPGFPIPHAVKLTLGPHVLVQSAMKLMVRLGAVVGLALTLLITGCRDQTGTNEQSVNEPVSGEGASDRQGSGREQPQKQPTR
jgi:hypothetical protein